MAAKNDTTKLAATVGLVPVNTEQAIRPLVRDILLTMHKTANPMMRGKIEKLYTQLYHSEFSDTGEPIQSTALLGPPGHGKTTAFKQAARQVASGLGMRYLENGAVDAEENITDNDFVFVTQETSGIISPLEWMGLPTSEVVPNSDLKRMGRLYSGSLIKLQSAGGGVLLLDDFLNASPSIQGVGLSLTLEKRYNRLNLDKVYIGLTGNLGALDGTYTTRPSTALRNRCKTYFAQDTLENWAARVQIKYNDEMSDAGCLGFLQKFEQYFSEEADIKKAGGFATPRSWEALVVEMRRVIQMNGGRANMSRAIDDIRIAASSIVGLTIGGEITTYFSSLANSADPLARAVIMENRFDDKSIEEKFKAGFSANEQHFGYQYVTALADYAVVHAINNKGNFDEAITRFAKGIFPLTSGPMFAMGLETLQKKMAARMPQHAEKIGQNESQLSHSVKEKIGIIMAKNPLFTSAHRETLISTLSGIDKFASTARRRTAART